jgi:hypothetical protein
MTAPRGTGTDSSEAAAAAPPQDPRPAPSSSEGAGAVPRAGLPRHSPPAGGSGPGAGWASASDRPRGNHEDARSTVLPGASAGSRPAPTRPPRPTGRAEGRPGPSAGARPLSARSRRARLSLRRIDPWSVFLFSLVASVFLGLAMIVAITVLYAVLGALGVTESVNQLFVEVTGGTGESEALLTAGRIVGGAALLAAVNVVFLTLLATLGALLYNLCASFTGGVELTLGEGD